MNLSEEYYRRHSLTCPLIKRPESKAYLITRCLRNGERKPRIQIVQLTHRKEPHLPDSYSIHWVSPSKGSEPKLLDSLGSSKKIEWDEFESEIISLAKHFSPEVEPIGDLLEAKLAIWEMFLYCYDERLCELDYGIRMEIFNSIDSEKPIAERVKSQHNAISQISSAPELESLKSRWQSMIPYFDPRYYAQWLADMVTKMRANKEYANDFGDICHVA